MLFRRKIPRSCTYCSFSTCVEDDQVLCIKKGVVNATDSCRKFQYDPCKRVPPKQKAMDFTQYKEEDFNL